MKNDFLVLKSKLNYYYDRFSKMKEKIFKFLYIFLLFIFLFSSLLVFLNYKNSFSRKVFYFYSEKNKISNVRYLKSKRSLKENLDILVKDFLFGTNEGFSLNLNPVDTRLLYSFLSNDVYYISLSKEFYDSFEKDNSYEYIGLKVNEFKKSLFETINFNYPHKIKEIIIFVEGHILG